ncbi:hypothetical protein PYCCODRAFT_391741 [Trametes coccinea BRFM310]|uniref:Uncharacterized protein n=1 Tax=Trametes coccinea (strain BRFM310) TaxID=1353009 RepID=A0A1Y2J468_TRAC3|nr:hypothetical protein PYCCODRAFT_391741 [Trametes coccinea BRFM310]
MLLPAGSCARERDASALYGYPERARATFRFVTFVSRCAQNGCMVRASSRSSVTVRQLRRAYGQRTPSRYSQETTSLPCSDPRAAEERYKHTRSLRSHASTRPPGRPLAGRLARASSGSGGEAAFSRQRRVLPMAPRPRISIPSGMRPSAVLARAHGPPALPFRRTSS